MLLSETAMTLDSTVRHRLTVLVWEVKDFITLNNAGIILLGSEALRGITALHMNPKEMRIFLYALRILGLNMGLSFGLFDPHHSKKRRLKVRPKPTFY